MTWAKAIVRMSLLLGFSLTALAVAVARLLPEPVHPIVRAGQHAHPEYVGVNEFDGPPRNGSMFLDPASGSTFAFDFPDTESLLFSRTTRWADEHGQLQVVGRWMSRRPGGTRGIQEIGLARFRFPSGEPLDHVLLDIVPAGYPCWYPGRSNRILYAGTDGLLYELQFDGDSVAAHADPPRPAAITWACELPGRGEVRVSDPFWPSDPSLDDRLIVSLSYIDEIDGQLKFTPEQTWWLKLSSDGLRVESAGRMSYSNEKPGHADQERMPVVASTADGGLVMAYLARVADPPVWELRLARVELDPATRAPRAWTAEAIPVADRMAISTPAFSPHARWLFGVRKLGRGNVQVERYSTDRFLPPGGRSQLSLGPPVPAAEPGRS